METITIILTLAVIFPICWFVSEFYAQRGTRIVMGVLSIAVALFVSVAVGSIDRMRSNSYFGDATGKLIDTVIAEMDAGNEKQLLKELKQLRTDYHPSYETRADFDKLVDNMADRLADHPASAGK